MATENAVKSAADGDGQNQYHSRVRTYVKKKLGMSAHQDVATRMLHGE
jgi:hypothetical protein